MVALLAFAAGVLGSLLRRPAEQAGPPPADREPRAAFDPGPTAEPITEPGEVVRRQMDALARYRGDRSAIQEVYAYASPANRAVTGPLDRFERMILARPYDTMAVNRGYRIGQAVEHGDLATVLVTVVGPNNEVRLYRFYLSRDAEEKDAGWLTDRVSCLTSGGPIGSAPTAEI